MLRQEDEAVDVERRTTSRGTIDGTTSAVLVDGDSLQSEFDFILGAEKAKDECI